MSLKSTLEIIFEELGDGLESMMDQYGSDDLEAALNTQQIVYTVEDCFGGENQGSDYWCVWKFSKDGEECFVKFYGYYASHYGTDYQGWTFVTPQQKTITVYQ
jgi:hypothetical protein